MLTISKSFEFCASHTLQHPAWDADKNRRVFGKCANPNGHGHNYRLEVALTGSLNNETGMIVNTSLLSQIVEETIIFDLDHKNLNHDVPWLAGTIPTSEAVVDAIWRRLQPIIEQEVKGASLYEIKLWETRTICAVRKM